MRKMRNMGAGFWARWVFTAAVPTAMDMTCDLSALIAEGPVGFAFWSLLFLTFTTDLAGVVYDTQAQIKVLSKPEVSSERLSLNSGFSEENYSSLDVSEEDSGPASKKCYEGSYKNCCCVISYFRVVIAVALFGAYCIVTRDGEVEDLGAGTLANCSTVGSEPPLMETFTMAINGNGTNSTMSEVVVGWIGTVNTLVLAMAEGWAGFLLVGGPLLGGMIYRIKRWAKDPCTNSDCRFGRCGGFIDALIACLRKTLGGLFSIFLYLSCLGQAVQAYAALWDSIFVELYGPLINRDPTAGWALLWVTRALALIPALGVMSGYYNYYVDDGGLSCFKKKAVRKGLSLVGMGSYYFASGLNRMRELVMEAGGSVCVGDVGYTYSMLFGVAMGVLNALQYYLVCCRDRVEGLSLGRSARRSLYVGMPP